LTANRDSPRQVPKTLTFARKHPQRADARVVARRAFAPASLMRARAALIVRTHPPSGAASPFSRLSRRTCIIRTLRRFCASDSRIVERWVVTRSPPVFGRAECRPIPARARLPQLDAAAPHAAYRPPRAAGNRPNPFL
jgi:hypothetical protein